MMVHLNFVMPFEDYEKIKALVINKLDIVRDVKFNFEYEEMAMDDEQIVRLYLPYMIENVNGDYVSITKMIVEKKASVTDAAVTYYALGDFATDRLNERLSHRFS